jgi:glycosyltransferase involved in cell wall biosynthesis
MTTYNGAAYVGQQLESLARQTMSPIELQIGDDGSTDETEAIVADFAKSAPFPVTFVRNETQLFYGENFIRTALRCSGDWIAFCDQDDVWDHRKFEWASGAIDRGPADLNLLVHNAVVTDERLNPGRLLHDYPSGETVTSRLQLPPEWYSWGFTQIFSSALVRDIPSEERVSFPWHKHRDAHDVWIALLANCTGSVLRSSNSFALYRRHAAAVTAGAAATQGFERSGAGYAQRASYLNGVSLRLQECALAVPAQLADLLTDAAERIDQFARQLDTRAHAYSGRTFSQRLGSIASLLAGGAYLGRSPWAFGPSRLAKDLLRAARLL